MDKEVLRRMIWEILQEEAGTCAVKQVEVPNIRCTEADRLDTGDPSHRVYTHDLFTLEESPRLGCGIMEMEQSTFPWTLRYDEIDYVISGRLTIRVGGREVSAGPGAVILIPKDTAIEFSAGEKTRFLYVTYPADWQNQKAPM